MVVGWSLTSLFSTCGSGNDVGRINEVTLRRAQLVQRWVTVRGNAVLVCNNQRLRPTQPPMLSCQGAVAVPFGWDVPVGLASHCSVDSGPGRVISPVCVSVSK